MILPLVGAAGGLQHFAGRARIDDDRDVVLIVHLVDQQLQGVDHQRQLVGLVHRAGHVEQECEVQRRAAVVGQVIALHGDPHQFASLAPRRRRDLHRGRKRHGFRIRQCVVVIEIVYQLLDPHRILSAAGRRC